MAEAMEIGKPREITNAPLDSKRKKMLEYIRERIAQNQPVLGEKIYKLDINLKSKYKKAEFSDVFKKLVGIEMEKDFPDLAAINAKVENQDIRVALDKTTVNWLYLKMNGKKTDGIEAKIKPDTLKKLNLTYDQIRKKSIISIEIKVNLGVVPTLAAENRNLSEESRKAYESEQPFIIFGFKREYLGQVLALYENTGEPARVNKKPSDKPWKGEIENDQTKVVDAQIKEQILANLNKGFPSGIFISKPYDCITLINRALASAGLRRVNNNAGNTLFQAIDKKGSTLVTAEKLVASPKKVFEDAKPKDGDIVFFLKAIDAKEIEWRKKVGDRVFKNPTDGLTYAVSHVSMYTKGGSSGHLLLQAHINRGTIKSDDAVKYIANNVRPYNQENKKPFNAIAILPLSALGVTSQLLATVPKKSQKTM
ncbi:MAG: hypothetical protein AABX38_02500 [Candidatus Micrarchaeota archaeon]